MDTWVAWGRGSLWKEGANTKIQIYVMPTTGTIKGVLSHKWPLYMWGIPSWNPLFPPPPTEVQDHTMQVAPSPTPPALTEHLLHTEATTS